jgi:hypothetical protein
MLPSYVCTCIFPHDPSLHYAGRDDTTRRGQNFIFIFLGFAFEWRRRLPAVEACHHDQRLQEGSGGPHRKPEGVQVTPGVRPVCPFFKYFLRQCQTQKQCLLSQLYTTELRLCP